MPRTRNVLIIDGDKTFLEAATRSLNDMAVISCASNSKDAQDLILKAHVIITSLKMSSEVSATMKQYPHKENINSKLIITSAKPRAHLSTNFLKLGAFEYLEKPIDLAKLRETIFKALEKTKN